MEGVDEVYGFHNWPSGPVGTMQVIEGPTMGHVSELDCRIFGSGGHGSQPHAAVDAIHVACKIVDGLHSIVSRNVKYSDTAVISVCSIHAGTAYNVLPPHCDIKATIRDLDPEVFALLTKRIHEVVHNTAAAYGARAELEIRSLYPAVVNHAEQTQIVRSLGQSLLGADAVSSDGLPMLAAEDFSYFLEARPGCFFFLGGAPDNGDPVMCHNDGYDFNDGIIPIAAKMYLALIRASLRLPSLLD